MLLFIIIIIIKDCQHFNSDDTIVQTLTGVECCCRKTSPWMTMIFSVTLCRNYIRTQPLSLVLCRCVTRHQSEWWLDLSDVIIISLLGRDVGSVLSLPVVVSTEVVIKYSNLKQFRFRIWNLVCRFNHHQLHTTGTQVLPVFTRWRDKHAVI